MQTQSAVAATTAGLAHTLADDLQQFLRPLLTRLDESIDARSLRPEN
jgi:hypothetical protein